MTSQAEGHHDNSSAGPPKADKLSMAENPRKANPLQAPRGALSRVGETFDGGRQSAYSGRFTQSPAERDARSFEWVSSQDREDFPGDRRSSDAALRTLCGSPHGASLAVRSCHGASLSGL